MRKLATRLAMYMAIILAWWVEHFVEGRIFHLFSDPPGLWSVVVLDPSYGEFDLESFTMTKA
ncbi:MAG: hypothetical protein KDH96_06915 [Candidatus Riesia sp.]|nr:hypothetical protein [Candidatus Riesia sp.]